MFSYFYVNVLNYIVNIICVKLKIRCIIISYNIILMNVRHIILLLKTSFRGPVNTPLGRWNIGSHKQTSLKIKYANEDHCGTCGDYNTNKVDITPVQNHNPQFDEDDLYVYMMGMETVPTIANINGK